MLGNAEEVVAYLKEQELDELDKWINMEGEENDRIRVEIAQVMDVDPEPVYAYCRQLEPAEFSSLEIVYGALSEFSTKHFCFLNEEVTRLLSLLSSGKIEEERVEVLESIDMEQMYEHDQPTYVKAVLQVVDALDPDDSKDEKLTLLSILYMYLCDYDTTDQLFTQQQFSYLNELSQNGSGTVKKEAQSVLELLGFVVPTPPEESKGNGLLGGFKKLMGW